MSLNILDNRGTPLDNSAHVRGLVERLSKEDASMVSFQPARARSTQQPGAI